mmetsp:Transcript_19398/g.56742  ORF Transcript_19398/g.56742 Transcript_19398/m.56742 type:complete len:234 (+) Transcript_19398:624-1325(+)
MRGETSAPSFTNSNPLTVTTHARDVPRPTALGWAPRSTFFVNPKSSCPLILRASSQPTLSTPLFTHVIAAMDPAWTRFMRESSGGSQSSSLSPLPLPLGGERPNRPRERQAGPPPPATPNRHEQMTPSVSPVYAVMEDESNAIAATGARCPVRNLTSAPPFFPDEGMIPAGIGSIAISPLRQTPTGTSPAPTKAHPNTIPPTSGLNCFAAAPAPRPPRSEEPRPNPEEKLPDA